MVGGREVLLIESGVHVWPIMKGFQVESKDGVNHIAANPHETECGLGIGGMRYVRASQVIPTCDGCREKVQWW